MDAVHAELWARIQGFPLDDPASSFPFSAKLAKENGWSSAFAARAIEEYRRFAFLGVAAGHPVSPSEVVDEVWHMHLTYTQSYWNHFCPEVLKKPFHHQPSTGGEEETEKLEDWYNRTLESYQTFFGEPPPEDIWPEPGAVSKSAKIDRSTHWVIPKPNLRKTLPRAASVLVGLVAVGCTGAAVGPNPFDWSGPDFLIFYVALFGICLGVAGLIRYSQRQPSKGDLTRDLNLEPYSIAYLRNGPVFTLQVVIADLLNRGELEVNPTSKRIKSLNVPTPDHNRIQTIVLTKANVSIGVPFRTLMAILLPEFRRIEIGLYERGLLSAKALSSFARIAPAVIMLVPIVLGIGKAVVGNARDRPVMLLVLLLMATAVVPVLLYAKTSRRSRYGDQLLKQLRKRNVGIAKLDGVAFQPDALPTSMAVFGMSAIIHTDIGSAVMMVLPPPTRTSSPGGCSEGNANAHNGCSGGGGSSGGGGGSGGSCGHGGHGCGGCHH